MSQLDHILQRFVVSVDGFGKAGSGEKCSLPKIKKKMESYRGGGMIASRKYALGYEEFSFELELSAVDPQVIKQSAFLIKKDVGFSVRGFLDGDGNAKHTVYLAMRGEVEENDFGSWEAGKKTVMKVKVALQSCKMVMDGETLFDIDVANDALNFAETDIGAVITAALGA